MTIEPAYHPQRHAVDRLEVTPFARHNWKTADSRDEWSELLQGAGRAKGVAEWKSVMDGATNRRAAIVHVTNQNREEWIRRVGDHGLVYRDIRYSEPYDGFSHKFYPTDKQDPNRITYSVLAESEDVADKMVEAEMEMDGPERHRTVGELLGFPDCCLEFFNNVWLQEQLVDPIYEISCNTDSVEAIDGDREHLRIVDPNPGASILWKYFGWSFITHIPCSWDCEKSIDIGRERYRLMCENGFEAEASALAEWLSLPATWSGLHALAEVKNAHCIGTSKTSSYFSEKQVVWGEEHEPRAH